MSDIYLALDFPTWIDAEQFLEKNELYGIPVKVGLELFYREGSFVIEQLKRRNHPIFLDLKLHDIPTTVERAMRNLARLEVDFVNVHAFGGGEMIKRAKEGLLAGQRKKKTKLLAVTVLTSFDEQTMQRELNVKESLEYQVIHFASLAKESGADGVVCSVHEVTQIKNVCGEQFITMTPGIRLSDGEGHDQKRIATPKVAKRLGTDHIVIGRSITLAKNQLKAYDQALEEWNDGTTN